MHYLQSVILFFALISIWGSSCIPPDHNQKVDIEIDLKDEIVQKIYNFQNLRQTDSLISYFDSENPSYRYISAIAFASCQDENAISNLEGLLDDPIEKIRTAAAYSIGQIGGQNAESILLKGFDKNDTLFVNQNFNKTVLEAIGKCGSINTLKYIGIADYEGRDTLEEGQALALYRFALKKKTTKDGTSKMLKIVKDKNKPVFTRVIAANYLGKSQDTIGITEALDLMKIITDAKDDLNVRMQLVIAVSKTKFDLIQKQLIANYKKERDYRVKCNIIRSLKNFPYVEVQSIVFSALKENNTHVNHTASQFFVDNGNQKDAAVYWRLGRDTLLEWETKINLFTAANKHAAPWNESLVWSVNNDLKKIWKDTTLSDYKRAAAIKGLAQYGWNYKYIIKESFAQNSAVLKTACMEGLSIIANRKDFNRFYGLGKNKVRKNLSSAFSEAMNNGDAAMKAIVAEVLANKKLDYKSLFDNSSFLHVALRSLKLPQETETAYSIQKAIDYFEGNETEKNKAPAPNHPIDWDIINNLDSIPLATFITNKGNFQVELFPELAPSAVSNFAKLTMRNFYNKKPIHRVVSNFVIQGGCPRGDGYGSLDYTIESELPMANYSDEGYLGMADAGIHTAGTQWFITHSPALHLDGKYTIFGKVKSGMNVVHEIMKGDLVNEIKMN